MIYSYQTPVGTFVIKPQTNNPRYFGLWVGDECYGSYTDARTAASDVFSHVTGYRRICSAPIIQTKRFLKFLESDLRLTP